MNTRSAKEVMLCWNPGTAQVALVAWPDPVRASGAYQSSALACYSAVQKMTPEQLKVTCFIEAMHLIVRDGCDPVAVHQALLGVSEYVDGCADDMPGIHR
jgi:hypothetical protein